MQDILYFLDFGVSLICSKQVSLVLSFETSKAQDREDECETETLRQKVKLSETFPRTSNNEFHFLTVDCDKIIPTWAFQG